MFLLRQTLKIIAGSKLSVFLFHKVPATVDTLLPNDLDREKFIRVLDFITQNFKVLPLQDAVKLLAQKKLPKGCAAITFDDGYQDWRQGASEILAQRSIAATFFITAGQFEGRPMWHERLANIVRNYQGDVLDTQSVRLPPLKVSTLAEKIDAVQTLEFHFKYLPPLIRDQFLDQLEINVGAMMADLPAFTKADLIAIADRGFEIGAHTMDHPILGLCNTDQAQDEIGKTREILEGIIKRPIKGFAYPNGRPWVDFSYRHIEMLKTTGYDYAVTTQWGVARQDTSPYQIPRFTPWGPSRRKMSIQLLRNVFTEPEVIPETPRT